ncbi:uncharacterized protein SPAPADRAFT_51095 [Spathaspora passalidarum NRRL Y-27907]|uniref:ubiquitinyl hydrolase 1 n=1 Tax=Spathaspora passalidarum (strain NRRL Y-27907 / 11-Y1) TaxID=619300 RepID=G3ANM2_SPAPN|nr:uncharacterized protein SPAPADRAFT_51095 [Spathaspora passalidarum NRRL Y-27907]EGW32551.1 hypothetical protein SPAPADRAFT_51095 [Spathaspora passalidarum NRRL Y-27907]
MLRRFKSNDPSRIFPDSFWLWYMDSYAKVDRETTIKHTPFSPIRYNDKSHSVTTIIKGFKHLSLPVPSVNAIIALLRSPFTRGDVIKTFHLLRVFQLSEQGLFLTNSGVDKFGCTIRYMGAENWDNVMCYMDALLFSMFANLESFEPILFISNSHNPDIDKLRALLRAYVTLLRSGNLITTDITVRLCELLAKLGFKEAMSHKQQDAAALFEFLTECLSMPLLTFKIDIKHGGKYSQTDDEKFSRERILFVSIPEEEEEEEESTKPGSSSVSQNSQISKPLSENSESSKPVSETPESKSESKLDSTPLSMDGPDKKSKDKSDEKSGTKEPESSNSSSSGCDEILLEECLEHYFNNTINVERELERELERRASILSFNSPLPTLGEVTYSIPEDETVISKPTNEHVENIEEAARVRRSDSIKSDHIRTSVRHRSSTLSIWSLAEEPKQVSLPAWMFLRLLPFYTDDNPIKDSVNIANNSRDFANRKPILPICLKRYEFNNSTAIRSSKRIIIPPVINLPNFVVDDIDDDTAGFKLILESAICHRGNSISSGHFISVVRKDSDTMLDVSEEEAYAAKWYLYDDMRKLHRVVEKSFSEVFSTEWPYMLFYRLVAIEKDKNPFAGAMSENPFVPKGAQGGYWDESLSVTASAESVPAHTTAHTNFSIPIPDVPATDPKFVDVRDKYYWYVLDGDKNYYKEELTSEKGSSSIGLSPQFRRNSQWSTNSNISSIKLDKVDEEKEKENLEAFPVINSNNSDETIWQKIKRTGASTKVDSTESLGEIVSEKTGSQVAFTELADNGDTDRKKKRHFHHRDRKKSVSYQKEKCVIV